MPAKPIKLTPWSLAPNYAGETWEGYLVAPVAHNRDSELIDEANWEMQLQELRAIDYSHWGFEAAPWEIVREGHWACGWIEWVAINPHALQAITAMELIAGRLDQYPVLNDDHLSGLEHESACETFDRYDVAALAEKIGEAFGLKARTVERLKEFKPNSVLGFALEYIGVCEIRAEGGGASFVWEDVSRESHPLTRETLAHFLFTARHNS